MAKKKEETKVLSMDKPKQEKKFKEETELEIQERADACLTAIREATAKFNCNLIPVYKVVAGRVEHTIEVAAHPIEL